MGLLLLLLSAPASAEPEPLPAPTSPPPLGLGLDLSAAPKPKRDLPGCRAGVVDDLEKLWEVDLEALLGGEVTTSYSRATDRVDAAPVVVTVVTREQLMFWGYQSVLDILEHLPGFYTVDDHLQPSVAVRGVTGGLRSESGLLKVMLDGRPVSFLPTGANWLGPELIPMTAVERIEIVQGPTSTVYGADAFLGVVNIITRESSLICGADLWADGTYAGGPGGGFDFTFGTSQGDVGVVTAVRLDSRDRSGISLPDSSPNPRLRAGDRVDEPARSLIGQTVSAYTRLTYFRGTASDVSLTGQISAFDRNADFGDWLQLATGLDRAGHERGSQLSLARGYLNLSGNVAVHRKLELSANAGYFSGWPTGRERIDVGSDITYVRRTMDFRAGLFDLGLKWNPVEPVRIVTGADLLLDQETLPGALRVLYADTSELSAGDVVEEISVRSGERSFRNVGVYSLATWTPTGDVPGRVRLRLDAGVRDDHHNIYGNQINGRLGASLRAIDPLTFKLGYSSAFRAPSTQLLFGAPLVAGDILGNAQLRPQHIHTLEGSLSYEPAKWLRASSSLSYNYVVDKAEFVNFGVNSVARNLAKVRAIAWQSEARLRWTEQGYAYLNYTLVNGTRDLDEEGYRAQLLGSELEVYPPMVTNFGLGHRLARTPLRATAQARWISARRASDANVLENGSVYTLPPAFYLDGSLALVELELLDDEKTNLLFSVRNLLDNDAAHPGFSGIDYSSAPRTFLLQWQQGL